MEVGVVVISVVGIIALAVTIRNVVTHVWPKEEKFLTAEDVIDNELRRLHGEMGHFMSPDSWISEEIKKLNDALAKMAIETNTALNRETENGL